MQGAPRAQSDTITIGVSGQGRPIQAVRFGSGAKKLVIVGDTHGGPEANTFVLSNELIGYFRATPGAVPAGISLYIIPTLNPDGLAAGVRFNGRGVDLNRNMNTNLDTCAENDWNTTVQGAYGYVSDTGGPFPDSEVESRVIRRFLLDASGAIFLHSNAGLVFPAYCDFAPSIALAERYASGSGYLYSRYWPNYFITGGMHDWASSLGIAAITPELITGDQSELSNNLGGVLAVLEDAETLLPALADREQQGIIVPALLWRFWKAYGGTDMFGEPLAPATVADGLTRQVFARAILEQRADSGAVVVEPAPLGRPLAEAAGFAATGPGAGQFFPETGHTVREAFLDFWQRYDGMTTLGLPLSEEFVARTIDGQERPVQYFERGIVAYYPEDGSVRLEPLGWLALLQEQFRAAPLANQPR